MAEVIYTPDGKGHPLLRPGDFLKIVEEYAGKDAAACVEQLTTARRTLHSHIKGEN